MLPVTHLIQAVEEQDDVVGVDRRLRAGVDRPARRDELLGRGLANPVGQTEADRQWIRPRSVETCAGKAQREMQERRRLACAGRAGDHESPR
jgi:hypothetical protein